MTGLVYAVVAYVRSPVGSFVEELRREMHPSHTHADAHITILPPRTLTSDERQAFGQLQKECQANPAFEVTMGDAETFAPLTPTVFLRVARGAYRLRELHDKFNREALYFQEPWPYMPHLTIAKMDTIDEARKVLEITRQRWQTYDGSRTVRIESLTFVKGVGDRWMDVATTPLGGVTAK